MNRETVFDTLNASLNKEKVLDMIDFIGSKTILDLLDAPSFVDYINKNGSPAENKSLKKKSLNYLTKPSLTYLLSLYLCDENNVNKLYESLTPELKQVLHTCSKEFFVTSDMFSDKINANMIIIDKDRWGFYNNNFSSKFALFLDHTGYRSSYYDPYTYILSLNGLSRLIFADILKIGRYERNLSYKPDPSLRIFSHTGDVFKMVDSCRMLLKRDAISVDDIPTASVCRKFAGNIGIEEIFPSGKKISKWWRTYMLIRSLVAIPKNASSKDNIINAMNRLLCITNTKKDFYLAQSFLYPHLKGFNRSGLPNHYTLMTLAANTLHDLYDGTETWIDFNDFMRYLWKISGKEWQILGYNKEYYHCDVQKVGTYDDISYRWLYKYYTEPLVKAYFFVLATFGLAEIAICDTDKCEYSEYDPIRAMRLTPFGSYMLGFTDSYEPDTDSDVKYEVFDDRLVVRVKSASENPETLLTDVMLNLGGGRYLMTEASFLKNCRSGEEIDSKIDFFKMMVSPNKKLPKVWQDFFAAVKLKSGGLKECNLSEYVLFNIDPSREDLLRIFSTDHYISSHCARVEGYRVLIEKPAISYIFAKLRSLGYLIER